MIEVQNQDSTTRRRGILPIVLVLSVTLVTGAVHGRLSHRWGPQPDLVAAASHLEEFPQQVGDWKLLSNEPLDEATVEMLSCAGYVNRQYVNQKTGESVWIAIMLGPAGPIAVHTPEICYSSRAYSIDEQRELVTLSDSGGRPHTFWSMAFSSNNPSAARLRVCYAWHGTENWKASKSPRFEFGGKPYLYKLQIASNVPAPAATQAEGSGNPCERFLDAMLRSGWKIDS